MSKLFHIICIIILIILVSCEKMDVSEKQAEVFVKYFGMSNKDYGVDVVQTRNGNYALLGRVFTEENRDQIALAITDPNGNLLNTIKLYGDVFDDEAKCLLETSDGGFLILGNIRKSLNNKDVYIIRTNPTGDSLWTRTVAISDIIRRGNYSDKNDEAVHMINISGNRFLLVGNIELAEDDKDIWMFEMDISNKNDELEAITYGWSPFIEEVNFVTKENENYVFVGSTNNPFKPDGRIIKKILVFKTSEFFTPVGFKDLSYDLDSYGECIRFNEEQQNFLLLATISDNDLSYLYQAILDIDLNVVDEEFVGNNGENIGSYILDENDGYMVIGTLYNEGSEDIFLRKLDKNGNEIYQRLIGNQGDQYGAVIRPTQDGGYVLVGTNDGLDGNSEIALIKTNSEAMLE